MDNHDMDFVLANESLDIANIDRIIFNKKID